MNLPFTVFAGYDYIYELSQCLYSIPCHLFFSWLVYMESRKTHSVSLEINSFFFSVTAAFWSLGNICSLSCSKETFIVSFQHPPCGYRRSKAARRVHLVSTSDATVLITAAHLHARQLIFLFIPHYFLPNRPYQYLNSFSKEDMKISALLIIHCCLLHTHYFIKSWNEFISKVGLPQRF